MLSERLRRLGERIADMDREIAGLKADLESAKTDWPDHQVRGGAKWHSRDVTPPRGWIWASDGDGVWLIHGEGKPIAAAASAVKFWTAAFIPAPPTTVEALARDREGETG